MTRIADIGVGGRVIGDGQAPYLIAEVAWGHDGKLDVAFKLIREAKEAGAHAVGLHVTSLDHYMTRDYRCLDGQTLSSKHQETTPPTIYKYLEKADLSRQDLEKAIGYARELGVHLCMMCNDRPSLEWVKPFRPESYALPAASFVELDFVESIAKEGVPTVLRIGGATLAEIEAVVNVFRMVGNPNIVLLHGIQLYPTKLDDLNLGLMPVLRQMFGCHVGLADHIDGGCEEAVAYPLMSVPLGAVVIEKHFTDDRSNRREDFEAALGASEFKLLAKLLAQSRLAVGRDWFSDLTAAELRYRKVVRKKVVAACDIAEGEVIEPRHLACKRSDQGGDPRHASLFLGRRARLAIRADGPIDFASLA